MIMEPTLIARLGFPLTQNTILTEDKDMNLNKEINRQVGWSIVASVIMMIAGVLAILAPQISGIAATIFIGSLLVVAGVGHLAYALYLRAGGGLLYGILLGLLCIGTGAYMLLHPSVGLTSLTLALAAWLFMQAILEFILAFYLRPLPGVGWMVFDGIITIILGTLICLTWPANTDLVIGVLVGASLICSAMTRLIFSLDARHVAKALFPEERHEAK
jgi:uncharacterized membrane protein HdeD (DUF308 family)